MKKILAILLSLALLLPLCACSGSDYKKAEELLAQGRYEEAEAAFLALGDYQDSAERAKDCRYQQGLSLMAEGRYEEATELFKALGGYQDSTALFNDCRYQQAMGLMDEGRFRDAESLLRKLGDYRDSAEKMAECREQIRQQELAEQYQAALDEMEAGKYEDALRAFEALDGYGESAGKIEECRAMILKTAEAGDHVFFGSFEQDGNAGNGPEPIEWLVLDKQKGRSLLVSLYALDARPYHEEHVDITWEDCSLRAWLNGSSLQEAFDAREQGQILLSTVTADQNPMADPDQRFVYPTDAGSDTQDKVFLLSLDEAARYFGPGEKACVATAYAVSRGAYQPKSGTGETYWWLRTPGQRQDQAAVCDILGGIYESGQIDALSWVCVRPAIWLDTN